MQHRIITENELDIDRLEKSLPLINIRFEVSKETGLAEVVLNDKNIEKNIRTLEVSRKVSPVAAISAVRRKLVEQQQLMGKDSGIVMDGRDIGTVVFPKAELKLFMTATAKDRAERRYKELVEKK